MKFTEDQTKKLNKINNLIFNAQVLAGQIYKELNDAPFTIENSQLITKLYLDLIDLETKSFELWSSAIFEEYEERD